MDTLAEKMGKVVYTSPGSVKVLSTSLDQWLAGILLQSARAAINFTPSDDRTGYVLETPSGTYPAPAVNGRDRRRTPRLDRQSGSGQGVRGRRRLTKGLQR
jgi:hypothetical protein